MEADNPCMEIAQPTSALWLLPPNSSTSPCPLLLIAQRDLCIQRDNINISGVSTSSSIAPNLLCLAPELLTDIFYYLLNDQPYPAYIIDSYGHRPPLDTEILRTNRYLHELAADTLYRTNVFLVQTSMSPPYNASRRLSQWLCEIGEASVGRLRYLKFNVDLPYPGVCMSHKDWWTEVTVDLAVAKWEIVVRWVCSSRQGIVDHWDKELEDCSEKIEPVFIEKKGTRWTKEDILALHDAVVTTRLKAKEGYVFENLPQWVRRSLEYGPTDDGE